MSDRSRFYVAAARSLVGVLVDVLCWGDTYGHTTLRCLLGRHDSCPGWSSGRPPSEIRHCRCDHHYRLDHLDEVRQP